MAAFDFEMEDLDISIVDNTEDGGDGGAADAAAVQDANDAGDTVEEVAAKFAHIGTIIGNHMDAASHLNKFGFSKEFAHIHNKNNKFGRAIGLTLPSFESDDEPGDVDTSDVEIEIVVEAIGEKLKTAKQWIIDFFKKIYLAIKDFFTKYLGLAARLEKRLKKIKSEIVGKNADRGKYGDLKADLYKWEEFKKMVGAVESLLSTGGSSNMPSAMNGFKVNGEGDVKGLLPAESNLSILGYEYNIDVEKVDTPAGTTPASERINSITVVTGGDAPSKESDTLDKLGWGFGTVSGYYDTMLKLTKALRDVVKLEKAVNKAETAFNKNSKTNYAAGNNGVDEMNMNIYYANLTKIVRGTISAQKTAARVAGTLIIMYCSTIEKAKIKK